MASAAITERQSTFIMPLERVSAPFIVSEGKKGSVGEGNAGELQVLTEVQNLDRAVSFGRSRLRQTALLRESPKIPTTKIPSGCIT